MRDRLDPNPMNTRTPDSHYPWTRKWGAGHKWHKATGKFPPRRSRPDMS